MNPKCKIQKTFQYYKSLNKKIFTLMFNRALAKLKMTFKFKLKLTKSLNANKFNNSNQNKFAI